MPSGVAPLARAACSACCEDKQRRRRMGGTRTHRQADRLHEGPYVVVAHAEVASTTTTRRARSELNESDEELTATYN
jgi:hypothetical protein